MTARASAPLSCPTCGAFSGEPCRTSSGGPRRASHAARVGGRPKGRPKIAEPRSVVFAVRLTEHEATGLRAYATERGLSLYEAARRVLAALR